MSILDDLPEVFADALGEDVFKDATLTRTTVTAGANPWDPPGSTTTTDYPCKALRDTFGATWLSGGLVAAEDVKIILLAATLAVEPQPGDRITIGADTWTISPEGGSAPAVRTDPANSIWETRARR